MCEKYEDDADYVYPDTFGWKSLTCTNMFEERFVDILFNKGRSSVPVYIVGTFLPLVVDFLTFLFCITKVLLLVFCYQSEYFNLFGENYPLCKMIVIMVGWYTAGNFLNILYIFLYLIFTKVDDLRIINIVILWIKKLKHIEIYEPICADLCNNKRG